jgi:cytidylate kinase
VTPARVLVSGPTASGKSALASWLAIYLDAEPVGLGGLNQYADPITGRPMRPDRPTALAALKLLRCGEKPVVVESTGLAMLLEPHNEALVIELEATIPIRADRLRDAPGSPALSHKDFRQMITQADLAAARAMRGAWTYTPAGRVGGARTWS